MSHPANLKYGFFILLFFSTALESTLCSRLNTLATLREVYFEEQAAGKPHNAIEESRMSSIMDIEDSILVSWFYLCIWKSNFTTLNITIKKLKNWKNSHSNKIVKNTFFVFSHLKSLKDIKTNMPAKNLVISKKYLILERKTVFHQFYINYEIFGVIYR